MSLFYYTKKLPHEISCFEFKKNLLKFNFAFHIHTNIYNNAIVIEF